MTPKTAEKTACTKQELARALRVSITTIYRWTLAGCPCFYVGTIAGKKGRPRYELDKVRAWLEARALATTGKEVQA